MSNESEADETEQDPADESENEQVDEGTELPADEEPEETDAETGDEVEEAGLGDGDFVEIDYTARTVEGDQLVDTTDAEIAEDEGVGEDQEFGPQTIVLGEGHLFEAVEQDLYGREVGDSGSVVVSAEEAFGEFDEDEVRTVSADRIPEDDRYPGAHVDIDGEHGHVETIIGGRARVDFNHPLAGEDVEYEYEVLDLVEDRQAKAESLLDIFLDMELDLWFETDVEEEEQIAEPDEDEDADADDEEADADDEDEEPPEPEYETVEVEKETLYVEATPQLSMNQQWMMGKQQIAQQLVDLLGVDRVIVQETLGEGAGMMGGMGGMMGGMGGDGPSADELEEALDDDDIDAEEIVEELEGAEE